MARAAEALDYAVFPSELGWMGLVGSGKTVQRLVVGYDSPQAVMRLIAEPVVFGPHAGRWFPRLVKRLQAYARGKRDDFRDIGIDLGRLSDFQRRVVEACRKVGYGRTSTYSALAAAAGSPGAARAAGTVMAHCHVPLIIPCHRVLAASGLGGYGGPQGLQMKQKLLEMEAQSSPRRRPAARKPVPRVTSPRTTRRRA